MTVGKPPPGPAPTSLPTFTSQSASSQDGLKDAWANLLEHHLLANRPAKQVFIGSGLPVLPKRLVEKMHGGEYINFNELIPFCDPGAEEEHDTPPSMDHYLFPGLGLIHRGHKLNYSFLQWASCFVTYMAVLASNGDNITHMCAYFQVILKASKEYSGTMWKQYDAQYRQKAAATHNKDWSTIDSTIFNQCFTGRARHVQGCSYCASIKHDTLDCPRRKGKWPAPTSEPPPPKAAKQRSDLCYNFNYHRPCHLSPCPYKHHCLKCAPEEHPLFDCPKRQKRFKN